MRDNKTTEPNIFIIKRLYFEDEEKMSANMVFNSGGPPCKLGALCKISMPYKYFLILLYLREV